MKWEQLLIEDLKLVIGFPETKGRYPVCYMHTALEEGQKIASFLKHKEVILVSITSNMDNWQKNMSPWPAKGLNKKMGDFMGEADSYIEKLMKKVLPQITAYITESGYSLSDHYAVGYSMGGLFTLYMMTKTSYFKGTASISGSLWYDAFEAYMKKQEIAEETKWYFSVGNKEAHTKNERMKQVERCTEAIATYVKEQGRASYYEFNEGGHFQDVPLRIAKGIDFLSQRGL